MVSRTIRVAMAAAVILLLCGIGNAQNGRWGQRDNPWTWQQNRKDQKEYQKGVRDGQNDRQHNRSYRPRHNEQDYMAGYRSGYGQNGIWNRHGDRDNDHDRDDRNRGVYGNNGGYGYPNGGYPNGGNPYPNSRYPNNGYPNNGYPNGPYGNQNTSRAAYQNGYQEGIRIGQNDRNARRDYKPTNSSQYKNGMIGYYGNFGDRNLYKQEFQNGFRQGYQIGFYGGYRR